MSELREAGLEPKRQPFRGSRSLGARLLAHVLVAAIGAALLWTAPVATVLLAAIALLSLLAENTTRIVLLSWPLARSVSHNVVARASPPEAVRGRIILSAHYDTQRSGIVHAINRYLAPMGWRAPLWLKPPMLPVGVVFLAQVAVGAIALAVGTVLPLTIIAAILLGTYGVLTLLFLQWATSRSVPGAADNASGVAAVLELAESWRHEPPPGVELVVLLCGCEETGMLGAAAWLDRHRQLVREVPTVFLNLDGLGFGPPRFLGADVPIIGVPLRYPADLLELCGSVAHECGLRDAGPHALPGPTDGLAFLARRVRGVTVVGFRAGGVLPHYHTMNDTAQNMDFDAARAGVNFAHALLDRLARHLTPPPPGSPASGSTPRSSQ